jgi:hypothetical protein
MQLDLQKSWSWNDINLKFEKAMKQKLATQTLTGKLLLFPSVANALYELSQYWIKLMPHKKNICVQTGVSGAFEFLIENWYREGLHPCFLDATKSQEELAKIFPENPVLYIRAAYHSITGQSFDRPEFSEQLNSQRVPEMIYFSELPSFQMPKSYQIFVYRLPSGLALAHLGERVKFQSFLAGYVQYLPAFIQESLQQLVPVDQNEEKIKSWEAQNFLVPYFSQEEKNRILKNIQSQAVVQAMQGKGYQNLQSLSLCAWEGGGSNFLKWWPSKPDWNSLKGMIVVSVTELEKETFRKDLLESIEMFKTLQQDL